jgi:hypothetical protein
MLEIPVLAIEFPAVPGFPPLGDLPFPCTGFHGPENKNCSCCTRQLPTLEEGAFAKKCDSQVAGDGLIGDREAM